MDILEFEKYLRGETIETASDSPLEATTTSEAGEERTEENSEENSYDPFSLIEKTIRSDFDSSVFETVDDSDLPLAENWLDFCINSRYLENCTPFPKQIKFGLEFFADYCPDCSDPAIIQDMFNQPLQEILDRVQLLQHGRCPKCGKNRLELVAEGKLRLYNELAGCAGQRSGKCLAFDTMILTEDGVMQIGEYCRDDFITGFNNVNLKVFNGSNLTKAEGFYKTEKVPIYKVELEAGLAIKGKLSHPIKTLHGFTVLKDLKVGTPVEVHYGQNIWGNKIPEFDIKDIRAAWEQQAKENQGLKYDLTEVEWNDYIAGCREEGPYVYSQKKNLPPYLYYRYLKGWRSNNYESTYRQTEFPQRLTGELARLLGYHVSEGRNGFIANTDREVLEDIVACASKLFSEACIVATPTGVDMMKHQVQFFFDRVGCTLAGSSATKEIPMLIRQAPKNLVVEFLKALFEGDGGVEGTSRITYCTISQKLSAQLSAILLNLGIVHKLHSINTWATNGSEKQVEKRAYILTIVGKYLEVFQKEIGFISTRKQRELSEAVAAHNRNRQRQMPFYYDRLPEPVRQNFLVFISEIKKDLREYWHGSTTGRYGFLTLVHHSDWFRNLKKNGCLTRQKVLFLIDCIDSSEFKERFSEHVLERARYFKALATSNSYWSYVKSTEIQEDEIVYDFSIPEKHQFWTNGLISHNSAWVAMTANYQLHRFLKIQNPSHYFKLLPNQTLHMVFVALTFKQASETLWQPFLSLYDSSPWIKEYHKLLDYHGEKLGRELYESQKTILRYDTKRLTIYPNGPDKSKLRGRTQFFSSIDELGWFLGDDKAIKLNPDEICAALENALQTIRSTVEFKRRVLKDYNAPDALFVNISSPSAANDKIMRLVREKSPTRYSFHLPTWEMNPNITRESLEPLFIVNPMKAERDFGANPPLSDKPFISNPDVVESAITPKFKNTAHYQTKLETDTLGHTTVKIHKFKMDEPCTMNVNHIIGVDTGRTKNAFAVVVQHYDLEIKSCVIDGIIEVRPQENIAVHFPSMFECVIKPIIQTRPVGLVVFDKWQSISFEDELHDLKVEAERYSLKAEDFNTIRGMLLSNKVVIPKTEIKFEQIKDPTQDYETLVEGKPVTHFTYQLLTVRDLGNTVTKGLGTDDDIFRAWCLGVRFLVDAKWQKVFQKGAKRKGRRSIGVMFGRTGGVAAGSIVSGSNGPLGIVGGRSKR